MLPSPASSALALRAWGGVGGGGTFVSLFVCKYTPTPNPSPQPPRDASAAGTPAGGGEHTEFAACVSPNATALLLATGPQHGCRHSCVARSLGRTAQEPRLHAGPNMRGTEGLGQIVGHAAGKSRRRVLGAGLRRDQHDGHV